MDEPRTKAENGEGGASRRRHARRPIVTSVERAGRHFKRLGLGSSSSASAPKRQDHGPKPSGAVPPPARGGPTLPSGQEKIARTDDLVQYHLDLLKARVAEMGRAGGEADPAGQSGVEVGPAGQSGVEVGLAGPLGAEAVWRTPSAGNLGDLAPLSDLLQANKRLRSRAEA